MRAYHRIDPLMDERKSHYSPAQLGAFLKVQLLAGRQSHRGRFRSMKALTGALPAPYVRIVPFLVEQGDVVLNGDGTLYVDGWDEWQEGDLTVKDRMARLRNRHRNATVTGTVTNGVTEPYPTAIRSSVGVSVGVDALSGATARASGLESIGAILPDVLPQPDAVPLDVRRLQKLAEELTGQPYAMANVHGGLGAKAITEQLPHGFGRVEQAWRKVAAQVSAAGTSKPTLRQLVLGADDALNPVPQADDKERRAEEAAADFDKRVARTKAEIARLHAAGEPA